MKMRRHLFREEQNQLIFHDTLEIMDMNATASFIYKTRKNSNQSKTVQIYADHYQIELSEALEEVNELLDQFESLGIKFSSNEAEVKSYAPHTPIVHIIQNCNSPCIMCDCWKTTLKNFHPANVLKNFHLKMKELGAKGIMVSGGEPLLHPEIKTILKDLKEMKMPIFLNTNGILLHKHMDWLSQLEVEELVFSLDGTDKDSYRLIRGTPMYEKVLANIKEFRKRNQNTRIILRTSFTKYNAFNIDQLVEIAQRHGVDHIGFSPLDISSNSFSRENIDSNRAENLKSLLLPSKEQIEQFLINFKPGNKYYDKIQMLEKDGVLAWDAYKFRNCLEFCKSILISDEMKFSPDPCLFPIFSMVVDYNGDLKNCFYSNPFGNLYNLDNIEWNFESQMQTIKKSKKCETCRGKVFCDLGIMKGV